MVVEKVEGKEGDYTYAESKEKERGGDLKNFSRCMRSKEEIWEKQKSLTPSGFSMSLFSDSRAVRGGISTYTCEYTSRDYKISLSKSCFSRH